MFVGKLRELLAATPQHFNVELSHKVGVVDHLEIIDPSNKKAVGCINFEKDQLESYPTPVDEKEEIVTTENEDQTVSGSEI